MRASAVAVVLVLGAYAPRHFVSAFQYYEPRPLSRSEAERRKVLRSNTFKLKVSVTLDRQEYMPGEAAQITISVSNPTFDVFKAYEPFKKGNGQLVVSVKTLLPDGSIWWRPRNQEGFAEVGLAPNSPTKWFVARETMEQRFDSYESHFGLSPPMLWMPETPGEYQVAYVYGGAAALFRVIPAKVEMIALAGLAKPAEYTSSDGKMVQSRREVRVVELEAGGLHHIVVTRFARTGDSRISTDSSGNLIMGGARVISPYLRIASLPQPITSLQAVADDKENASIAWSTADGRRSVIMLDADRKQVTGP